MGALGLTSMSDVIDLKLKMFDQVSYGYSHRRETYYRDETWWNSHLTAYVSLTTKKVLKCLQEL